MSSIAETLQAASEHRIRFVADTRVSDVVLMSFTDPAPTHAILFPRPAAQSAEPIDDALDVTIFPWAEAKQTFAEWLQELKSIDRSQPVFLKSRGVELWWSPERAVLQCDAEQAQPLLSAIVEFSHYERELRRIEQEVAAAWTEVEEDRALAFQVSPANLRSSAITSARMSNAFQRRIRFARTEPHLNAPDPGSSAIAEKLGQDLRERAQTEARLEALDAQLEVFEHIYEMASQRMGEFKAARQGHIMEWVIIWLLAAEALLMLTQTLLESSHR